MTDQPTPRAPERCPMCGHGFHHDTDCGETVGYDHLNGAHECGCPGEAAADDLREQIAEAVHGWLAPSPINEWALADVVMDVLRRNGMIS